MSARTGVKAIMLIVFKAIFRRAPFVGYKKFKFTLICDISALDRLQF